MRSIFDSIDDDKVKEEMQLTYDYKKENAFDYIGESGMQTECQLGDDNNEWCRCSFFLWWQILKYLDNQRRCSILQQPVGHGFG